MNISNIHDLKRAKKKMPYIYPQNSSTDYHCIGLVDFKKKGLTIVNYYTPTAHIGKIIKIEHFKNVKINCTGFFVNGLPKVQADIKFGYCIAGTGYNFPDDFSKDFREHHNIHYNQK